MEGSEESGGTLADDFGRGYVNSLNGWATEAYNKAYAMGKASEQGLKDALEINSPSKVGTSIGENLGGSFGNGFDVSLSEAIARIKPLARSILGGLPTAADITRTMRVNNMPNISQEIVVANEQAPMTMVLDGHEVGYVMAGYNQQGLNAYQRAFALGVGK